MRAVTVEQPGNLDALAVVELADPQPRSGEVLVAVDYAACNWGDIQKRQGIYPDPMTYPLVLGGEGAGTVIAVGTGVETLAIGQPVAFISGRDMLRAFADEVAIPAELVVPLPPGFDRAKAAALPVAALTAYHLLHTAHHLRAGDRILVHAISGGVGLALTQLVRDAGAIVLGTVGTGDKAAQALALGAERVIARDVEDFVEVIMRMTDGAGIDLVIDSLGADILERSFDVLRPFGRLINIGEAAGDPEFDVRKALYRRSTSMAGFELMHAVPGSPRWNAGVRHVMQALEAGTLEMPIAAEFPLEEIRDAQALLESRRTIARS